MAGHKIIWIISFKEIYILCSFSISYLDFRKFKPRWVADKLHWGRPDLEELVQKRWIKISEDVKNHNNIFNCRLSVEYMSKSRYWWKMSKWRKTGSRNDHKEMFQTMKRERTIHLGIKSEEDVCTSWEIIFEIFEILHLNIWILKVMRMSAHHETLILRYFQLVPARRSN